MTGKYHATKVHTPDGTFDSGKEYKRWCDLKLLEKGHAISDLRRQVKYELIPDQYIDGRLAEKSVSYIADFVYRQNGRTVVEDTKGMRTREYIIKRKLMLYHYGIRILEI